MGFSFGNSVASVEDYNAQVCFRRLGATVLANERTLSTLVRNNASTSTITAGAGLTGGGPLNADSPVTLNVGAGAGITVNADSISIATAYLGADPTASVGLSVVNGSATSYMRSDAAPALSQAITPTWTNVHTFSAKDIHNAGVSLGTSGRLDSAVANSGSNIGFLIKPTTTFTGSTFIMSIQDDAGNVGLTFKNDRSWEFNGSAAGGGYITVSGTLPATSQTGGILFQPKGTSIGASVSGLSSAHYAAQFFGRVLAGTATTDMTIGGSFLSQARTGATTTGEWAGVFQQRSGLVSGDLAHVTDAGGWRVVGARSGSKSLGNITNWYGGYVENSNNTAFSATNSNLTNAYGIYLEEQTRAGTINNGIFIACANTGRKSLVVRDQNTYLTSNAAAQWDMVATTINFNATNMGFYGVAGVARPSAYTQTYSTATRTHSNPTAVTLTDSTGGSANTTCVAVSGSGDDTNINNNFADIIAQINALVADVANVKQLANSIIDDGQSQGLLQ